VTPAEVREQVAAALDALTQECAMGYYDEAIPSDLDGIVASLVDGLVKSTPGEREQMLDEWLDQWQLGMLSMFCIRICGLAVREASPDLLQTALVAQVFEGFRLDPRDGGYQALGVAHHTVVKLEADPREVFANASTFANPMMAQHLQAFELRPDLPDILALMRYHEGEDPDGFRYEFTGWPPIPAPG
jgi:hypothetical protein